MNDKNTTTSDQSTTGETSTKEFKPKGFDDNCSDLSDSIENFDLFTKDTFSALESLTKHKNSRETNKSMSKVIEGLCAGDESLTKLISEYESIPKRFKTKNRMIEDGASTVKSVLNFKVQQKCTQVNYSKDPTQTPFEELPLKGHNGILLFGNKLYYADKNTQKTVLINQDDNNIDSISYQKLINKIKELETNKGFVADPKRQKLISKACNKSFGIETYEKALIGAGGVLSSYKAGEELYSLIYSLTDEFKAINTAVTKEGANLLSVLKTVEKLPCTLLKLDKDPTKLSFNELKTIKESDALILFDGKFYFANQSGKSIVQVEVTKFSKNDKGYNELMNVFNDLKVGKPKKADKKTLELITKVTKKSFKNTTKIAQKISTFVNKTVVTAADMLKNLKEIRKHVDKIIGAVGTEVAVLITVPDLLKDVKELSKIDLKEDFVKEEQKKLEKRTLELERAFWPFYDTKQREIVRNNLYKLIFGVDSTEKEMYPTVVKGLTKKKRGEALQFDVWKSVNVMYPQPTRFKKSLETLNKVNTKYEDKNIKNLMTNNLSTCASMLSLLDPNNDSTQISSLRNNLNSHLTHFRQALSKDPRYSAILDELNRYLIQLMTTTYITRENRKKREEKNLKGIKVAGTILGIVATTILTIHTLGATTPALLLMIASVSKPTLTAFNVGLALTSKILEGATATELVQLLSDKDINLLNQVNITKDLLEATEKLYKEFDQTITAKVKILSNDINKIANKISDIENDPVYELGNMDLTTIEKDKKFIQELENQMNTSKTNKEFLKEMKLYLKSTEISSTSDPLSKENEAKLEYATLKMILKQKNIAYSKEKFLNLKARHEALSNNLNANQDLVNSFVNKQMEFSKKYEDVHNVKIDDSPSSFLSKITDHQENLEEFKKEAINILSKRKKNIKVPDPISYKKTPSKEQPKLSQSSSQKNDIELRDWKKYLNEVKDIRKLLSDAKAFPSLDNINKKFSNQKRFDKWEQLLIKKEKNIIKDYTDELKKLKLLASDKRYLSKLKNYAYKIFKNANEINKNSLEQIKGTVALYTLYTKQLKKIDKLLVTNKEFSKPITGVVNKFKNKYQILEKDIKQLLEQPKLLNSYFYNVAKLEQLSHTNINLSQQILNVCNKFKNRADISKKDLYDLVLARTLIESLSEYSTKNKSPNEKYQNLVFELLDDKESYNLKNICEKLNQMGGSKLSATSFPTIFISQMINLRNRASFQELFNIQPFTKMGNNKTKAVGSKLKGDINAIDNIMKIGIKEGKELTAPVSFNSNRFLSQNQKGPLLRQKLHEHLKNNYPASSINVLKS